MCGIAAIFAYRDGAPKVERDELLAIRDHMASRGPDGIGEWISEDRRIGLGHRRLSIIDLSPTGAQPMFSEDGSLAIVFNGEIYNYRELRERLERDGRHFISQSDTEVLLHLYADRGEEMLEDVRGMYAFAIWDKKRNGIFMVRDPYGIKPLYYSDNGRTLRVASQVKALLAGGHVDLAPDPAGHVGYFLWGHIPEPYTLYRNIRSLPAGSTMWLDRDGPRAPKDFCNISQILREADESKMSNPQLLRSALVDTVRHHLIADVPVGVFLSSGLDSTTIAALAAEQGGTLRTVTLGFEEYKGTFRDETPLGEKVARQYGTSHQTIWVTRDDFQAEREHLFASMDQPSYDGANTFFVSLAAKRAGLKVAMSGLGGDEMFGGYPSFRDIPRSVNAFRFAQPFSALGKVFRVVTGRLIEKYTSPKYAGIFEYGGSYAGAYLLRRGVFMPWELPKLLDADMVRQGWQELQPLLRLEETVDGLRSSHLKVSVLETCWYMRNQLLRDSDWAGMAHSVEIRVPFVDINLLRTLAPLLAGENPPTKRDVANSPTQRLPDEILQRIKTGFCIPVGEWLLQEFEPQPIDRGLRGWARHVYRQFPGSCLRETSNAARHQHVHRSDPNSARRCGSNRALH
ncbi:MAG: asparagine synthase (glutamine-hydrolyzing) [Verrucomicrobiota bacterium]|nr:asparagine synthase (glutamine-hydrolyzing) [Verrucomicrobiota bacterium]